MPATITTVLKGLTTSRYSRAHSRAAAGVMCVAAMAVQAGAQCNYVQEVLADQPIAYYRFEEGSGPVAADSSGHGRNGVYVGGVTLGSGGVLADGSSAACFNQGYVDISDPIFAVTWQSFTVEAWVKIALPTSDFAAMVSSATEGALFHFQLHLAGNNVIYTNGGTVQLPIIRQPIDANWHHVAMVGASGSSQMYLDGVPFGGTSGHGFSGILPAANGLMSIARGFQNGRMLRGCMDEVALYHTALSPARIAAHFQAGSNGFVIAQQPSSVVMCPTDTATFSVTPSGTGSFSYQWQWRPAGGQFNNLIDGVNTYPDGAEFFVQGARNGTVALEPTGGSGTAGSHWDGRCVVTSTCGSVISDIATLTTCAADFNCDDNVDFFDYLDFVDAFSSQSPAADFNGDTTIDFFDYLDFVDAFSVGC